MERSALIIALLCVARTAAAGDGITASAPASAVGDGRSFVPVQISGMPKATTKELPVQDVATVACPSVATLAGTPQSLPAIIPPFTTKPTKLQCKATLRGAEAAFALDVRPPPAGLYANVSAAAKSSDGTAVLDAVEWDGKRTSPPTALRAVASDGTVDVSGAKVSLSIAGKAPRLVALVLADGSRIGAAFVPVIGVTTLPVESEANSNVEVWISGQWFGPVPTKGKIADVPIEVPPGVTHAVARSTSAKGYITDAVTDLKIPARPRIAAMALATKLVSQQRTTIAVAVAGNDGRPGKPALKVAASVQYGTIGAAKSVGGGLWTFSYTAPVAAGTDHVTIRVDGDDQAGTADVALEINGGAPAKVDAQIVAGPYVPGGPITGTVKVFDGSANTLPGSVATAMIGDEQLTIDDDGTLHGNLPEKLPEGPLTLAIVAGPVHRDIPLELGSTAATARIRGEGKGRTADVELEVRDQYGNLVGDKAFDVAVTNGTMRELVRTPRAYKARIAAADDASDVHVAVRANGRVLGEQTFALDPPPHAIVLGAALSGGYMDNLGALKSPRAGLGLLVRRGAGPLELQVSAGVEGVTSKDDTSFEMSGMTVSGQRTLRGLGVPLLLHVRVPIGHLLGVSLAGGVVATRAQVKLQTSTAETSEAATTSIGYRGQVTADLRLGPGRLFAGASFGRAKLDAANATGQVDGLGVIAGYEWWFLALGY